MKIAGIAVLLYGFVTAVAGVTGYISSGSWVSAAVGVLAGMALLVCGRAILKGAMVAGFVAAGQAMLLGLFFGYSFIVSGSLVPGGLMLIVSFVTLFFVLIGLFTTLARQS